MIQIESLLKDGWTKKMANQYLNVIVAEYDVPCYDRSYVEWAHNNGFFAETAYCLNLNDTNKNDYLSDYLYYKIWPLNNWSKIWINDKLSLKYIISGTMNCFCHKEIDKQIEVEERIIVKKYQEVFI